MESITGPLKEDAYQECVCINLDGWWFGGSRVDVRGGGGAGISPTIFLQDLPFYRFSSLNTYIYETKSMKDAYFEAPRWRTLFFYEKPTGRNIFENESGLKFCFIAVTISNVV